MSALPQPSSSMTSRGACAIKAQRGAAAVTILLLMLSLVAMLGLVEVGYLYWVKRDTQKVADLAALAGAQQLSINSVGEESGNLCARGIAAAAANIGENGFSGETPVVECRHWNAGNTSEDRTADVTSANPVNAIRVTVERSPVPFFGLAFKSGDLMIEASAVAIRSSPEVAFSVGSTLLDVNSDSPLLGLLKLAGVNVSGLDVASYKGLANVSLTTSGLIEALTGTEIDASISAADFKALLDNTTINIGQLLDLSADAASSQGIADVSLSALGSALASAGLSSVDFTLGDLLNVSNADPASAMNVDLNALDLLGAAITIAGKGHAVSIGNLSLLGGITVQGSIIEPASVAVGPVGTTAYNAQVRLYLSIDTANTTLPAGQILALLGTRVQLPVYIDVADGQATVTDINCNASPRTATFDVASTISNICIGKTATAWNSTTANVCGSNLQNTTLLTLLGTSLTGKISLSALESTESLTVDEGATGSTSNTLPIGTALTNLLSQALTLVNNLATQQVNNTSLLTLLSKLTGLLLTTLSAITNAVVAALTALLQPVLDNIGQLLSTLLANALGLELGVTNVHVHSIQCHSAQLVH